MEDTTKTMPAGTGDIAWKTEKNETVTELVSPDGRWRLSGKAVDGVSTRLYLCNYDLICSPGALGETEEECWEKFVSNCDEYANRLAKAKAEALAHLAEYGKNKE